MIQALKAFFGLPPKISTEELIANGAQIIDVRSRGEYAAGHLKGSVNIPLDMLHEHINKLKGPDRPIITCCASGIRSGAARRLLKDRGFTDVRNGGSWHGLKRFIK